jgi:hypothetical protein
MEWDTNPMNEEVKQEEEEEKGQDHKSLETQQIAQLTEIVGQLARINEEVNLNVVELSRVITDARKQENVADIRVQLALTIK